jgi:hypothetical protein
MRSPVGGLTQNGLFYEAAERDGERSDPPEPVRVYEKLRTGIWVFTGVFRLVGAWRERSDERDVFKFRLELREPHAGLRVFSHEANLRRLARG